MRNVLLATLLVLLFASSVNAGLFGRNRHSNDYVKKSDLVQYVLAQELEAAKLRISQNEQDIKQLQMLVVESKLDARINSVIDARIQAATQPQTTVIQPTYRKEPIQAPVEPEPDRFYIQPYGSPVQAPMSTQPTVIYETTKPVYQRIETLPPVRRVVQPTYRVQQVRQVR